MCMRLLLLFCLVSPLHIHSFVVETKLNLSHPHHSRLSSTNLHAEKDPRRVSKETSGFPSKSRRVALTKAFLRVATVTGGVVLFATFTRPAWASNKSRVEGYAIQKSDEEWRKQLSQIQYNILRKGGTERPGYSILVDEKREGVFDCVGCGTELFSSKDKFDSGTGWPSFARAFEGVEIEELDPISSAIGAGAELRCRSCGGHLGDVFKDGRLFLGSEAFKTGERFCIDGVALVFKPADGSEPVMGDIPSNRAT